MKKAVQKMCAAFIAAFVFALCLFAKPNTAQAAGGGWLYLNPEDNTWYYYVDGMVDTSYTGLAQNDFGWRYNLLELYWHGCQRFWMVVYHQRCIRLELHRYGCQ